MGASQIRERLTRAVRRSVEADGDRFLTSGLIRTGKKTPYISGKKTPGGAG